MVSLGNVSVRNLLCYSSSSSALWKRFVSQQNIFIPIIPMEGHNFPDFSKKEYVHIPLPRCNSFIGKHQWLIKNIRSYSEQTSTEFEDKMFKLMFIHIKDYEKLALSALYLQATTGPNNTTRPKHKQLDILVWDAWKKLGNMTKKEAEEKYIHEAKRLLNQTAQL